MSSMTLILIERSASFLSQVRYSIQCMCTSETSDLRIVSGKRKFCSFILCKPFQVLDFLFLEASNRIVVSEFSNSNAKSYSSWNAFAPSSFFSVDNDLGINRNG